MKTNPRCPAPLFKLTKAIIRSCIIAKNIRIRREHGHKNGLVPSATVLPFLWLLFDSTQNQTNLILPCTICPSLFVLSSPYSIAKWPEVAVHEVEVLLDPLMIGCTL